jgi:hypothetical protein
MRNLYYSKNIKKDIPDYIIQDGCHNCEYRKVEWETDCTVQWYCTFKQQKPFDPFEPFDVNEIEKYTDAELDKFQEILTEWETTYEVGPMGKCSNWSQ